MVSALLSLVYLALGAAGLFVAWAFGGWFAVFVIVVGGIAAAASKLNEPPPA